MFSGNHGRITEQSSEPTLFSIQIIKKCRLTLVVPGYIVVCSRIIEHPTDIVMHVVP